MTHMVEAPLGVIVASATNPCARRGRLGDGPDRRRVMLGTLGLVMLGSVLAALPLSYGWLLVGRGVQGVGLGLIPLAMTLARDHLPEARSRSTVGILSITASAGVGLGYPLTGLFADHWGFHAPFWFGATISGLAVLLAAAVLPGSSHLKRRPLDVIGALLLGAGFIAMLLCESEGESWGWTSGKLLSVALGASLILAAWVTRELRTPFPLVNLTLMRNRAVLTANTTGLFAGLGMYMLLPLVTRYVQSPASTGYGFGVCVVVAGLVLLPFSIASVSVSRLLPTVARRLGRRMVLPLGALFLAASMLGDHPVRPIRAVGILPGHGHRRSRHRIDLRDHPRPDRPFGTWPRDGERTGREPGNSTDRLFDRQRSGCRDPDRSYRRAGTAADRRRATASRR